MFKLSEDGKTLLMHRGNTGTVNVTLTGYTFGSNDRVLFRVADADGNVLKQVISEITNNAAAMDFANTDTDGLAAGCYRLGITAVTSPTYDNGQIVGGTGVCTPICDLILRLLDTAAVV